MALGLTFMILTTIVLCVGPLSTLARLQVAGFNRLASPYGEYDRRKIPKNCEPCFLNQLAACVAENYQPLNFEPEPNPQPFSFLFQYCILAGDYDKLAVARAMCANACGLTQGGIGSSYTLSANNGESNLSGGGQSAVGGAGVPGAPPMSSYGNTGDPAVNPRGGQDLISRLNSYRGPQTLRF